MKNNRRLNKNKVIVCLIILLTIVALVSIAIERYRANKYKDLTVLFNGEKTELLKEPIVEFEDNASGEEDENSKKLKEIFLSTDDIAQLFDKDIYVRDDEVITTCNFNIAYMDITNGQFQINDGDFSTEEVVRIVDNAKYLSLSKLQDVYDAIMVYNPKINTLSIEVLHSNEKGTGETTTDSTDATTDSTNAATDGTMGKVFGSDKEVKLFNQYNNISGVYEGVEVDDSKLNIVSPKLFFIGKNGNVGDETNYNSAAYTIYDRWASTNNLTIVPRVVMDEKVKDEDVFATYANRKNIATSLVEYLKKYRYDYVSIDIKDIKSPETFRKFMIEFSPRLKKAEKNVIWIYNKQVSKADINEFVDYIIEE